MYTGFVPKAISMSASIAQSRQQLAALIEAAQVAPQVITKRNTPVAVLVSTDYFKRTEAAGQRPARFYDTLLALRATYLADDGFLSGTPKCDSGLDAPDQNTPWQRENSFANE
jgi:prevent-host-death family protein